MIRCVGERGLSLGLDKDVTWYDKMCGIVVDQSGVGGSSVQFSDLLKQWNSEAVEQWNSADTVKLWIYFRDLSKWTSKKVPVNLLQVYQPLPEDFKKGKSW